MRLLELVADVPSIYPQRVVIDRLTNRDPLLGPVVRSGLQAIGWIRDERGLGGGRQMDGLAWALPLEQLWEDHVAAHVQRLVKRDGGTLRLGRKGQTVVPLPWATSGSSTLRSLVPDMVVEKSDSVRVIDAKYKAHLADIDEAGWRRMADDVRESHRADLHQVLAYSTLFNKPKVTATLAYPLPLETWARLHERGRDSSSAHLYVGSRHIELEIWGLPFGPVSSQASYGATEATEES